MARRAKKPPDVVYLDVFLSLARGAKITAFRSFPQLIPSKVMHGEQLDGLGRCSIKRIRAAGRACGRFQWVEHRRISAPTRIGLVQPNSFMDAATCAICSGVWVRGFVTRGISQLK